MPEDLTSTTEGEETLQEQLLAAQNIYLAQQQIYQLANQAAVARPSILKYSFLFLIAGVVDIVDIADFTFIGIPLVKAISLIGTGIIYFTLWMSNGKVKRAHQLTSHLEQSLQNAQQAVAYSSRLAMRTSKILGRFSATRGLARQIPRTMVKIRHVMRRNPMTKILLGGAINLVPWLAVLNLMVGWVYLSYLDEKKTLREAREAAQQAAKTAEGLGLAAEPQTT